MNGGLSEVAANTTIEVADDRPADGDAVVDDGRCCPHPARFVTTATAINPAIHPREVLGRTVTLPSVVQTVIGPCRIRSFKSSYRPVT